MYVIITIPLSKVLILIPVTADGSSSNTSARSATSATSTTSALSFFLSDSGSENEYELDEDEDEELEGDNMESEQDTEREDVEGVIDGREGWFDFADYIPKPYQDLDRGFESEGQWLSGCHPQPEEVTSWLDEDAAGDEQDELYEAYYDGNDEVDELDVQNEGRIANINRSEGVFFVSFTYLTLKYEKLTYNHAGQHRRRNLHRTPQAHRHPRPDLSPPRRP